jgi:hypothetical protein
MAKKASKRRAPAKRERKATKRSSRPKTAEEQAFIDSLVAHGQAVSVPAGGKLPPGATHELVEDEHGEVRAVRRRFSAL